MQRLNVWMLCLALITGCSSVNRDKHSATPAIIGGALVQPESHSIYPPGADSPTTNSLSAFSQAQPFVSVIPVNARLLLSRDVNVEWNPVTDDTPAYYTVYWSNTGSRQYYFAQNASGTITTVSNLIAGTTYYFAVTQVTFDGMESDFSDEFAYIVPTTLEMGFTFDQSVTNVSVQSSNDLATWQESNAHQWTNGLWRIDVDPVAPVEFYRGIGQDVSAL